jgi:hypothetical protein
LRPGIPPAPVVPGSGRPSAGRPVQAPAGPPPGAPLGAPLGAPGAQSQLAGASASPGAPGGRLLGDERSYQPSEQARPAEPAPAADSDGPRKVKLTVARIDPWSAMKLSFLLSVAFAIATVVAAVVVWEVLDVMGIFDALNSMLRDVAGSSSKINMNDYIGLGRVVAIATVVSLVNVVVTMALATLGAVLYNLAGSLVGGLNVTLSDD